MTSSLPACSLLLFVAVPSEVKALQVVANELGLPCEPLVGLLGNYFYLGQIGTERVLAAQTDMGPFGPRGSAAQAIHYMAETHATAVMAIGMAFGVDP